MLRPSLKLGSKGKMLKKNVKDYLFQIYIYNMEKVWILIDLCDFLDNVSYLIPLFIYHECVVKLYIYIKYPYIIYP